MNFDSYDSTKSLSLEIYIFFNWSIDLHFSITLVRFTFRLSFFKSSIRFIDNEGFQSYMFCCLTTSRLLMSLSSFLCFLYKRRTIKPRRLLHMLSRHNISVKLMGDQWAFNLIYSLDLHYSFTLANPHLYLHCFLQCSREKCFLVFNSCGLTWFARGQQLVEQHLPNGTTTELQGLSREDGSN